MTDSLKERLKLMASQTIGQLSKNLSDALARIEELEKDRAYYGQLYKEQHDIDKATIAKLEERIEELEKELERREDRKLPPVVDRRPKPQMPADTPSETAADSLKERLV